VVIEEQQNDRFQHVTRWQSLLDRDGFWHSFELPDGTEIRGANSLESQKLRLAAFPIPGDLTGLRALDIGTWDGWFAFELERRGAEVVAIDVIDNPRFRDLHRRFDSRVEYRQMDVYDLSPAALGQFDIVLFMGVLYHLKHPLLGLERVCAMTRGIAAVDSFVLQDNASGRPMMEFFERDEFGGQTDNWCAPNVPCLVAFCRTAGFARVKLQSVLEYGAAVTCYREWEPVRVGVGTAPEGTAPELGFAIHHKNFGINFDSAKDDSVTCVFTSDEPGLTMADVQPSVGRFGSIPLQLKRRAEEGQYECGFRLPPGLSRGWHEVRVRLHGGPPSNPKRIAVDLPLDVAKLRLDGVQDNKTQRPFELDRSRGDIVALWLWDLPANADKNNLRVFAGDTPTRIEYLEDATGKRQVNVLIPKTVPPGTVKLRAELGEARLDCGELRVF
jgi:tRNA (mo5U34)-methyltransferase